MNLYVCMGICILPFLAAFVLFKAFSSITFSTEIIASLLALAAVLPITFLQFFLGEIALSARITSANGAVFLFLRVLLFNGIIEEGLKMTVLLFIPRKSISFKNFFIASILCGLCFGCFESIIYFLQHLQSANERGANLIYHMIFMRIFTSDLIHALCSGLCGIFLWNCILKRVTIMPLIFAVAMHSLYNFFVGFNSNIKYFSIAVILLLALEVRIHYEKARKLNEEAEDLLSTDGAHI